VDGGVLPAQQMRLSCGKEAPVHRGPAGLRRTGIHSAAGVSRTLSPPDSLSLAPFPGICPPTVSQDCGLCLSVRI